MWIKIATITMATAVALGAFGAHGLKGKIDAYSMEIFKTATLYHLIHGIGLFVIAWLVSIYGNKVQISGWLMLVGIIIFSGSLYILSVTGIKWLGAITPIGGVLLIGAWLTLLRV